MAVLLPCPRIHMARAACAGIRFKSMLARNIAPVERVDSIQFFSSSSLSMPKETFESRYARDSILRSEFVYGLGFQGPGGLQSTLKYAKTLGLRPGMMGVDAGTGPGGAAFHLAEVYGMHTVGIDIAPDMVGICKERAATMGPFESGGTVDFKCASLTDAAQVPAESQDLVWCRDALIYLKDKAAAYDAWFKWLKPGGMVFVTDYGQSEQPAESYMNYVAKSLQTQETLEEAARIMRGSGFIDVVSEDITAEFQELYEGDLARFESRRDEFVELWGQEHFDSLYQRWDVKVESIRNGSFRWHLLKGKKI